MGFPSRSRSIRESLELARFLEKKQASCNRSYVSTGRVNGKRTVKHRPLEKKIFFSPIMILHKEIAGKSYRRKILFAISVFYVIAISLRYLTNKTHILSGLDSTFLTVILQGIGPTIGALVAFRLFHIRSVMTLKGDFNNFFVPLLIYWLLPIVLIEVLAYFFTGMSSRTASITILVYALFEEIGWRGFLQQVLMPVPKFVRISIVTLLWFIWHLNFDLSVSNLLFFTILLSGSLVLEFISVKTNSLLCVSAIHSLNNFYSDINLYKGIILSSILIIWILSIVYRRKLGGERLGEPVPAPSV